jgi:hypothetical protein
MASIIGTNRQIATTGGTLVSNARLPKLLDFLAHIAIALLLTGCAAQQLKLTVPPDRNLSFVPPQALHELSIEYIRTRPNVSVGTYGSMSEYKKKAGIDFVDRVVLAAGEDIPPMVEDAFKKLSVGRGTRYKMTITASDAYFLNQSQIGTFNAAGRVAFSVFITDSANRRLWEMTHVLVAERTQDLSGPMRTFTDAVVHNLIAQGWIHATAEQAAAFASVEDLGALPSNSQSVRDGYRLWLTQRAPRAFVVTDDGRYNAESGGIDPTHRAISACKSRGHVKCILYAVDEKVVYVPDH